MSSTDNPTMCDQKVAREAVKYTSIVMRVALNDNMVLILNSDNRRPLYGDDDDATGYYSDFELSVADDESPDIKVATTLPDTPDNVLKFYSVYLYTKTTNPIRIEIDTDKLDKEYTDVFLRYRSARPSVIHEGHAVVNIVHGKAVIEDINGKFAETDLDDMDALTRKLADRDEAHIDRYVAKKLEWQALSLEERLKQLYTIFAVE